MIQRYFVEISYNGSEFFGWQIQPNEITIQEVIESKLTRLNSNHPIKIVGCGRTDTGVHAHHFIFHVDFPEIKDPDHFVFKLNRMLPDGIAVHSIIPVDKDLHARFSAIERTYRYFIHQKKDPFKTGTSWHYTQQLDLDAMNEACVFLLGKQDFTSLSKLHTDAKTNICTIKHAKWVRTSDTSFYFEITADRFLRNMVRATVGTLLDVGCKKTQPEEMKTILEAKDRCAASTSVPAHGLYLWKIEYP